jgi:hypothetical protein
MISQLWIGVLIGSVLGCFFGALIMSVIQIGGPAVPLPNGGRNMIKLFVVFVCGFICGACFGAVIVALASSAQKKHEAVWADRNQIEAGNVRRTARGLACTNTRKALLKSAGEEPPMT